MKTDPERSDYIGTSDGDAFECFRSLESARNHRAGSGNGSSGFSRTSGVVFSFRARIRSFSLCVLPLY